MGSHGYMDEQEAMNLIAEFSRNQIHIVHQANSGTGRIAKNALAAEKKLSEQILSGLIGRKLDGSLKEKLAERLV